MEVSNLEECYLGIDPSTKSSGFAVMNRKGELLHYGVIVPDKDNLTEAEQALYQFKMLEEIVEKYNIVKIGCEDQHLGPNADTFKKLCRISGFIILFAGMKGIPIEIYTPSQWRKTTHGDGNGSVKKKYTRLWANEKFGLDLKTKHEDISDGIGITECVRLKSIEGDN